MVLGFDVGTGLWFEGLMFEVWRVEVKMCKRSKGALRLF